MAETAHRIITVSVSVWCVLQDGRSAFSIVAHLCVLAPLCSFRSTMALAVALCAWVWWWAWACVCAGLGWGAAMLRACVRVWGGQMQCVYNGVSGTEKAGQAVSSAAGRSAGITVMVQVVSLVLVTCDGGNAGPHASPNRL